MNLKHFPNDLEFFVTSNCWSLKNEKNVFRILSRKLWVSPISTIGALMF